MLSGAEVDRFVEQGFVHLPAAFPREVASQVRDVAAAQLHIDVHDPTSWREPVVRGLVLGDAVQRAAESPRLVEAIHQLLDPDDWVPRANLGAFVVRFPTEVDPGDAGWHIDASFQAPDGSWNVNYRSRERGLLLLGLLSDVGDDDAPTRLQPGSHRKVPALLQVFGEGGVFGLAAPVSEPTGPVVHATGEAGDVFLCHPFLVHAASWPHRGTAPRFACQPPIAIRGALRLDGQDLSPVARAVWEGLDG